MEKSFKLNGLDCPNCAAKIERVVNKMKFIDDAKVQFVQSKLTINTDENLSTKELQKMKKKIESISDVEVEEL